MDGGIFVNYCYDETKILIYRVDNSNEGYP